LFDRGINTKVVTWCKVKYFRFVKDWSKNIIRPLTGQQLAQELHQRGINLRHLGLIYPALNKAPDRIKQFITMGMILTALKSLVMVSRIVKNDLSFHMRQTVTQNKVSFMAIV